MKGFSHFIMERDGFILLHVLFVVTIVSVLVIAGATAYQNELHMTERHVMQMKIESLFQMARAEYVREQELKEEPINSISYQFPDGTVDVKLDEIHDSYRKLSFHIKPDGQHGYYLITHLLKYDWN